MDVICLFVFTCLVAKSSQQYSGYRHSPDYVDWQQYPSYQYEDQRSQYYGNKPIRTYSYQPSRIVEGSYSGRDVKPSVWYQDTFRQEQKPSIKITYKKRYKSGRGHHNYDQDQQVIDGNHNRGNNVGVYNQETEYDFNEILPNSNFEMSQVAKKLCENPKNVFHTFWSLVSRLLHIDTKKVEDREKLNVFLDIIKGFDDTDDKSTSDYDRYYKRQHEQAVPLLQLLRTQTPSKDKINKYLNEISKNNNRLDPTLAIILKDLLDKQINKYNNNEDPEWIKIFNDFMKIKKMQNDNDSKASQTTDYNTFLNVPQEKIISEYNEGEEMSPVKVSVHVSHKIEPHTYIQKSSKSYPYSDNNVKWDIIPNQSEFVGVFPSDQSLLNEDRLVDQKQYVNTLPLLDLLRSRKPDKNKIKLHPTLLLQLKNEFNEKFKYLPKDTKDAVWSRTLQNFEILENESEPDFTENNNELNTDGTEYFDDVTKPHISGYNKIKISYQNNETNPIQYIIHQYKETVKSDVVSEQTTENSEANHLKVLPLKLKENKGSVDSEWREKYVPILLLQLLKTQNPDYIVINNVLVYMIKHNIKLYPNQVNLLKQAIFKNLHDANSIEDTDKIQVLNTLSKLEKNAYVQNDPDFPDDTDLETEKYPADVYQQQEDNESGDDYEIVTTSTTVDPDNDELNSQTTEPSIEVFPFDQTLVNENNENYKKQREYVLFLLELLEAPVPDIKKIGYILKSMLERNINVYPRFLLLLKRELNKRFKEFDKDSENIFWSKALHNFKELENVSLTLGFNGNDFSTTDYPVDLDSLQGLELKEPSRQSQGNHPTNTYVSTTIAQYVTHSDISKEGLTSPVYDYEFHTSNATPKPTDSTDKYPTAPESQLYVDQSRGIQSDSTALRNKNEISEDNVDEKLLPVFISTTPNNLKEEVTLTNYPDYISDDVYSQESTPEGPKPPIVYKDVPENIQDSTTLEVPRVPKPVLPEVNSDVWNVVPLQIHDNVSKEEPSENITTGSSLTKTDKEVKPNYEYSPNSLDETYQSDYSEQPRTELTTNQEIVEIKTQKPDYHEPDSDRLSYSPPQVIDTSTNGFNDYDESKPGTYKEPKYYIDVNTLLDHKQDDSPENEDSMQDGLPMFYLEPQQVSTTIFTTDTVTIESAAYSTNNNPTAYKELYTEKPHTKSDNNEQEYNNLSASELRSENEYPTTTTEKNPFDNFISTQETATNETTENVQVKQENLPLNYDESKEIKQDNPFDYPLDSAIVVGPDVHDRQYQEIFELNQQRYEPNPSSTTTGTNTLLQFTSTKEPESTIKESNDFSVYNSHQPFQLTVNRIKSTPKYFDIIISTSKGPQGVYYDSTPDSTHSKPEANISKHPNEAHEDSSEVPLHNYYIENTPNLINNDEPSINEDEIMFFNDQDHQTDSTSTSTTKSSTDVVQSLRQNNSDKNKAVRPDAVTILPIDPFVLSPNNIAYQKDFQYVYPLLKLIQTQNPDKVRINDSMEKIIHKNIVLNPSIIMLLHLELNNLFNDFDYDSDDVHLKDIQRNFKKLVKLSAFKPNYYYNNAEEPQKKLLQINQSAPVKTYTQEHYKPEKSPELDKTTDFLLRQSSWQVNPYALGQLTHPPISKGAQNTIANNVDQNHEKPKDDFTPEVNWGFETSPVLEQEKDLESIIQHVTPYSEPNYPNKYKNHLAPYDFKLYDISAYPQDNETNTKPSELDQNVAETKPNVSQSSSTIQTDDLDYKDQQKYVTALLQLVRLIKAEKPDEPAIKLVLEFLSKKKVKIYPGLLLLLKYTINEKNVNLASSQEDDWRKILDVLKQFEFALQNNSNNSKSYTTEKLPDDINQNINSVKYPIFFYPEFKNIPETPKIHHKLEPFVYNYEVITQSQDPLFKNGVFDFNPAFDQEEHFTYEDQLKYIFPLMLELKAQVLDKIKIYELLKAISINNVKIHPSWIRVLKLEFIKRLKNHDIDTDDEYWNQVLNSFKQLEKISTYQSNMDSVDENKFDATEKPYLAEDFKEIYYETDRPVTVKSTDNAFLENGESNFAYDAQGFVPEPIPNYDIKVSKESNVLPEFPTFIYSVLHSSPSSVEGQDHSRFEILHGKANEVLLYLKQIYFLLSQKQPDVGKIVELLKILKRYNVTVSLEFILKNYVNQKPIYNNVYVPVPDYRQLVLQQLQTQYQLSKTTDQALIYQIMVMVNSMSNVRWNTLKSLYDFLILLRQNQATNVNSYADWYKVLSELKTLSHKTFYWRPAFHNSAGTGYVSNIQTYPNPKWYNYLPQGTANGYASANDPNRIAQIDAKQSQIGKDEDMDAKTRLQEILLKFLKYQKPDQKEVTEVLDELHKESAVSPDLEQFLLRQASQNSSIIKNKH